MIYDLDFLKSRSVVDPDTGCWEWQGSRTKKGYGTYSIRGTYGWTRRGSHRLALDLKLGRPVHPDKHACHYCDNASCCNPDHLWEGTPMENIHDMHAKGRARYGLTYKFTDDEIAEAVRLLAQGVRVAEVARRCHINARYVSELRSGRARRGRSFLPETVDLIGSR